MKLDDLPPFALGKASPVALVRRYSPDYDDGSDSLPLARVSCSRVPCQKNVSRLT